VDRDPADRARLRQIAEEQAALRRVATLVARGAAPEDVFTAVAEEVGRLLPVDQAALCRYEPAGALTFVSQWGVAAARFPAGSRWELGGHNVGTLVFQTGRSARVDYDVKDTSGPIGAGNRAVGFRSAIGTPIIVEGRLWGTISVASRREQPLPADTEASLVSFTELVATAVANTESRAALARLAEEQAALRRVAVLVAQATPPPQVFAAVAGEVGGLLEVDYTVLIRSDPEDMITIVGAWTASGGAPPSPVGGRFGVGGRNVSTLTLRTGRPARLDTYVDATGNIGNIGAHDWGFRSSVGVPISVEGRPWGLILVAYSRDQQLPADTEARLASFTELVATAIANTESRAQLVASRARIVAAADETRRRIERDLHDGTQQQLVSLILDLRQVQAAVPPELQGSLSRIADRVNDVSDQVREISHGIHPAILSERGLMPALRTLGRQSAVPVELDLRTARRLPDQVEVAAYYVVSEALTNAAKHARASVVHVELDAPGATLRLVIRDDGIGGADPALGSGLIGLRDRVEAVGGTFDVSSPAKGGTTLLIKIPVQPGPESFHLSRSH
jgi:signal transduction histidine kinase